MSCIKQIHDDSVSGVPDGVAGGVVTNPMAEEEAELDRGKAQQWLVFAAVVRVWCTQLTACVGVAGCVAGGVCSKAKAVAEAEPDGGKAQQ